jgi:hypothetical protein
MYENFMTNKKQYKKVPEKYISNHPQEGILVVKDSDLSKMFTKYEINEFDKFMHGQTVTWNEKTRETLYFLDDVERFLNGHNKNN